MEYNDVYDADRRPTGRVHLRGTRWEPGDYGLLAVCWIYDGHGKLLLTRRAREKTYAGTWENSGGAVQAGEDSRQAVAREVFEETGVRYEIDRLAVIHENFFNENTGSLKGLECHEIALYYLMKPRGEKVTESNSYTVGHTKEELHWIPIEELGKYKAFPSFMHDYLTSEHTGIEHIVTDERK